LSLPRLLQIEFSQVIQAITDDSGKELSSIAIKAAFDREYLESERPLAYVEHRITHEAGHGEIESVSHAGLNSMGVRSILPQRQWTCRGLRARTLRKAMRHMDMCIGQ